MRQKYILVLMAIFLFSPLYSLAAQPKIITGVGFEISYPFLTEDGKDDEKTQKDLGLDDSSTYLSLGARIPFIVAFEVAQNYKLGFGTYLSLAYQMARLDGTLKIEAPAAYAPAPAPTGTIAVPAVSETKDAFVLYERGEISFSPVFYNELVLSKESSLSLAVGPTFALSFGDKNITEIDGTVIYGSGLNASDIVPAGEGRGSFVREEALQFSFGVLFDLGLQIRFNETIGMGVDSFLKLYFTGQKTARSQDTWSDNQTYFGNWGGNVSLLLFL